LALSTNGAYAESINPEGAKAQVVSPGDDITQEEIDRRLAFVFEYLDEYANNADSKGQSQ